MEDKIKIEGTEKKIWIVETIELIKEKIFQIMHISLKYDSTSSLYVCILNIISLLQLLSLSFHTMVNNYII